MVRRIPMRIFSSSHLIALASVIIPCVCLAQTPLPSVSLTANGPFIGKDLNNYGFEKISNVHLLIQNIDSNNPKTKSHYWLTFDFQNSFDTIGMQKLYSEMHIFLKNGSGQLIDSSPFIVEALEQLDDACRYSPTNPYPAAFDADSDLDVSGKDIASMDVQIPNSPYAGDNNSRC
jgi:hypothetical protein